MLYYHLNKAGVIRKYNIVKSIKNNNEILIGIFIGIWSGDGSKFIDRHAYTIKINLNKNDMELIKFIRYIMVEIFDKDFRFVPEKETNQGTMILSSKFIYNFIDKYVYYNNNKTLTIELKESLNNYSRDFLKGFLLGLTLSDGYIKERFIFNVISKNLVGNLNYILEKLNYSPKFSIVRRNNPKWHKLYKISLNKKSTILIKEFLNNIIFLSGFNTNINELKRYN